MSLSVTDESIHVLVALEAKYPTIIFLVTHIFFYFRSRQTVSVWRMWTVFFAKRESVRARKNSMREAGNEDWPEKPQNPYIIEREGAAPAGLGQLYRSFHLLLLSPTFCEKKKIIFRIELNWIKKQQNVSIFIFHSDITSVFSQSYLLHKKLTQRDLNSVLDAGKMLDQRVFCCAQTHSLQ